MTQKEIVDGKPQNKIFFMIQKEDGVRIEAMDNNKLVGVSAGKLKTLSKQI